VRPRTSTGRGNWACRFLMHGRQDSAAKAFNILREEMNDEVSAVFLGRIDFFKANPPGKEWDCVFRLTVK